MATSSPAPLTPTERRARRDRVARIARGLGFVGRIEYRHVYSQTGGAQYGRGSTAEEDLLTVYAEGFARDADLEDFSLEAILAHERGHQLLARHPRIAKRVSGHVSAASEEILASLLGAMLCVTEADRDAFDGQGDRRITRPRGGPRGGGSEAARTVGLAGGPLVIGPKKLGTIREDLQRALSAAGDDPLRWLEERMAAPGRHGAAPMGESEVLHSLRRFLEAPGRSNRPRKRVGTKK